MIAWQQSNSNTSLIRQLADISGDLIHLSPEIAIVATLLMLLAFDLIFKNKKEVGLAAIGFTGLFATLAILVYSWTAEPEGEVVMNGFLRYDQLAIFLKILFVIGAISGLLIASQCKKKSLFRSGESMVILMGLVLGAFLMSAANNLLILYLSVETVSICSYLLTGLLKGKKRAEASLKYLLFGAVSSAVMLYGISWLYGFTGSLDFMNPAFAEALAGIAPLPLGIAMVMFLGGLIFKLGAVPFHVWSPDVYEGSPSSSTLFFAIVPKISIFILLSRLSYYAFPSFISAWQEYVTILAISSVIVGSMAGLEQRKLKSLLAYSSISHMGYLLISFSAGNLEGFQMLFGYLIIYIGSGLCIWSVFILTKLKTVYSKKQNKDLGDLVFLSKSNNMLAIVLATALFSTAGLPPMIGFILKLSIFLVAIEQSFYIAALISIVFSVVSTFFYLRIIKILFFEPVLVGRLYYPIKTSRALIGAVFFYLFIFLFINPSMLYLFSQKVSLLFV